MTANEDALRQNPTKPHIPQQIVALSSTFTSCLPCQFLKNYTNRKERTSYFAKGSFLIRIYPDWGHPGIGAISGPADYLIAHSNLNKTLTIPHQNPSRSCRTRRLSLRGFGGEESRNFTKGNFCNSTSRASIDARIRLIVSAFASSLAMQWIQRPF